MSNEPELVARATFARTYRLEDIAIRAGGDGRTVTAYAAVFDTPAEIHDQDGHYIESINPHGFDKTLAERMANVAVFYNHGKTLYGTPSEKFSVPLGVPEEIRADARGLLTVTRYNRNALANEILESIRNGDITGQSFSGKWIRSQRTRGRNGALDTIVRNEVMLAEYGPTPIPAYQEAAIVGVRAEDLGAWLDDMADEDRARIFAKYWPDVFLTTDAATVAPSSSDTMHRVDASPSNVDDAGTATSSTNDTPAQGHASGPTPQERRLRALALKGIVE